MFEAAIETASRFTRPIHTIIRFYGATTIVPGAATIILVNKEGWALTCKHVATELALADQLKVRYQQFKSERAALLNQKNAKHLVRQLATKHQFDATKPAEVIHTFFNCVDELKEVEFRVHPTLDIALIRLGGFQTLNCQAFPVFSKDDSGLKAGKYLCRLGFPFPEFQNFEYDAAVDQIKWNQVGRTDSPWFPIEGMVTRQMLAPDGTVGMFELSTPGLRGQSGGPAFDQNGLVWGMQSQTGHLDLNFDVDIEVMRNGQKKRIKESAFLNVGVCVHVAQLKAFMRQENVSFVEG